MTHDEAVRECRRLASSHPDRETHQWQPRQDSDGNWAVVKINVPPPSSGEGNEARADERELPEDPRPAAFKDVPPFGAA